MALLVDRFDGFGNAAHDAFRPDKWRSNQFNLERRRVRESLELLGELLQPRLSAAGVELDVAISSETPSLANGHNVRDLHLHFIRPAGDRRRLGSILDKGRGLASAVMESAPWAKHLSLLVKIDLGGVEVGATLPPGAWPDRDNAVAVLKDEGASTDLATAIGAIAANWQLRDSPLTIVRAWPRDHESLGDAGFADLAAEALLELLPVYQLVAWAGDNDRIDLERRIDEDAEAVSVHAAQREQARQARHEEHERRAAVASKRAEEAQSAKAAAEAAFRRLSVPIRIETPDDQQARRDSQGQGQRRNRHQGAGAPSRPSVREWHVGAEVMLGKGLLAGKKGVVKGQSGYTVTVAVGGLQVRVESRDLKEI